MTAPTCPICLDDGMTAGSYDLDCSACDAASKRVALAAHIESLGPMDLVDRDWAVFRYAQSRAPVATGGDIHCQEFHELAMDYRGAQSISYSIRTYKDLCAYINARIAPTAQPATAAPQSDVERDAARYRWLREKRDIPHGVRNIPWVVALDPSEKIHTSVLRVGVDLDHAIDAAMAQKETK